MRIAIEYRGRSDKLSGVIIETEKKTYQAFTIAGKEWTYEEVRDGYLYSCPKKGFHIPCDLLFSQRTLGDVELYVRDIKNLGFRKVSEQVDFGISVSYMDWQI